jgi:hypothetical protein
MKEPGFVFCLYPEFEDGNGIIELSREKRKE